MLYMEKIKYNFSGYLETLRSIIEDFITAMDTLHHTSTTNGSRVQQSNIFQFENSQVPITEATLMTN